MRLAVASSLAGGVFFAATTASAVPCSGRPTDPAGYQGFAYGAATVSTFDSARTRVHYATTGAHAPDLATTRGDAVPDTVAMAGQIAETSLAKYAEMGFKPPPGDGSCTSNGGSDKLDIYLVSFTGADGSTVAESCDGRACSSFVLVESTFAGRGYPSPAAGFRTVVAHELFHAVQNAYDHELDRFWAEGTAQWAMKTVYPELTDFENQLPSYFKDNTRSLDTQPSGVTAGFLYGAAVWPLFLTLRHGPDTVRLVFEKQVDGTKAVAAIDSVLVTKGSSMADSYPLFGAWNAATKALAGTGGYPDAAKYPGVKTEELADGVAGVTSGLPYFVYRGSLDGPSNISLETDPLRNAGVVVPIEGGKPALEKAAKLPANAEGEVLVVVAGITTKKTDAPFTVRIGPPDPGAGSSSGASSTGGGSSGGSSSSGGCAVVGSSTLSQGPNVFGALGAVLAGLLVLRARAARGSFKRAEARQ
jgi:hypothetical protein